MANVLKVSTPMGGYDNSANVRANPGMRNPAQVEAPVTPEKVVKPDARSDASSRDGSALKFKFDTSFDNFVHQLGELPRTVEELPRLFQEMQSVSVESGLSEGIAQEIAQFIEMAEVVPGNLKGFIEAQGMTSIRFTGAFFDLMRKVMKETRSADVKLHILDFVKRYTDMAESGILLRDIQRSLQEIKAKMLPEQRAELERLEGGMMYDGDAAAENPGNVKTLKTALLPYINAYISQTHDRGGLRNAAARLAEQISRYENGGKTGVLKAFEKLMDYPVFQKYFKNADTSRIFEILANTEFETNSKMNRMSGKLADIIGKGAAQQEEQAVRSSCLQIMRSILLNESVYMPVLHFMVPFSMDGRFLFSEWWIDPDAEGGGAKEDGTRERIVKGLIKFDIQELGFFDLYFVWKEGNKVVLQLNVPPAMAEESGQIRKSIGTIMKQHDLETDEFVVGVSNESIPLSEAFPKLRERKNSINVSI